MVHFCFAIPSEAKYIKPSLNSLLTVLAMHWRKVEKRYVLTNRDKTTCNEIIENAVESGKFVNRPLLRMSTIRFVPVAQLSNW